MVRVLALIADIERLNRFGCAGGRLIDCWSAALHSAMAAGSRTSKYSSMAFCCSVLLATVSVFMVQLCCTGLVDIEIGRGQCLVFIMLEDYRDSRVCLPSDFAYPTLGSSQWMRPLPGLAVLVERQRTVGGRPLLPHLLSRRVPPAESCRVAQLPRSCVVPHA